jgi:lipopolysaccharide assembly outer membrane protein LptD (OstA)
MLALAWVGLPSPARAQRLPEVKWTIQPLVPGGSGVVFQNGIASVSDTNGVLVKYGEAILTAQQVAVDYQSGDVIADGDVRIQQGDQLYVSQHVRYNFKTQQMEAAQFRTGQAPVFAAGEGLHGDLTNKVYNATNAIVTTDDIAQPAYKIVARRITIIPGKKIEAHDAVLYVEGVPVFYFPFYSRSLQEHANTFNFTPGYRNRYGPFILGTYTWYLSEALDGVLHADYREARGPGAGADVNYHLGRWGEGTVKYYYTHDRDPNIDELGVPIPEDRQRVYASYAANPATNLYVKGLVRYESDLAVERDFFESEYRLDPQPNSFLELNKVWQNFSVDTYVEPRLNQFLETVERLPEIKLTGYRQQLGASPFYYESESSAGYYARLFAVDAGSNGPPPGLNYEAARADTYHQVLLPETFFGWLNVTPRVGGRFTYYGEASGPGGTNDEQFRGIFNTGAEVSFKASRVWPGVQNDFFEVNGIRHIIEPSANYVYVPAPTVAPQLLPQFDYELPSLRLLPVDFPDYNSIDSIDTQNVIRWGLHNKLQTKRENQVVNLVNWNVYTDWRIKPLPDQTTFADLYSDLTVKPWKWLTMESLVRYDINGGDWRMSYSTLTIQPNNLWSWRLGHYYLRQDLSPSPTALGPGNDVFTSAIYYRFNENWGFRMNHYFDAQAGSLQEQSYTIYRDLRSWTAALSFLYRRNTTGPNDFGVAFTFSLKAYPRFGMGTDGGGAFSLLGG